MELLKLVTLLKAKKSFNGEYLAKCPGHQDRVQSFSFTEKNGTIVFKCFAQCNQTELFQKIKTKYEDTYGKEETKNYKSEEKTITKTIEYVYENEMGEPVLKVERIEFSDGTKTFRQYHRADSGNWEYGRAGKEFAPYNYKNWKDSNVVAIFEGEKCAIVANDFGITSTCIPGGAGAWVDNFAKYFEGKDVIIVPDNDEPGKAFAQTVFSSLATKSNPIIVELPGLEAKEDIVEWIQKGNTIEEFVALAKKIKANPVIGVGFEDEFGDISFIEKIQKDNSQNILPFGISFLDDAWGGILPTDLVVLSAKSGVGKTQMAMGIAKHQLYKGKSVAFFALEAFKKEIGMRMIYSLAVDKYIKTKTEIDPYASWADWVRGEYRIVNAMKKHTEQACAELKEKFGGKFLTHYLQKKFTIDDFEKRFPVIAKQCDLVILDHLHYISRSKDSPSGNEFLGDVMGRLKNLVEEFRVPILLVAHVRKEDTGDRKPVPEAEDIHGSSDIFKIGTKVALLGKPLSGGYDTIHRRQTTYIRVPKDRLGEIPDWMIGKLSFDVTKQSYDPNYDIVSLVKKKDKTGWEEYVVSQKPSWYGRSGRIVNELF